MFEGFDGGLKLRPYDAERRLVSRMVLQSMMGSLGARLQWDFLVHELVTVTGNFWSLMNRQSELSSLSHESRTKRISI